MNTQQNEVKYEWGLVWMLLSTTVSGLKSKWRNNEINEELKSYLVHCWGIGDRCHFYQYFFHFSQISVSLMLACFSWISFLHGTFLDAKAKLIWVSCFIHIIYKTVIWIYNWQLCCEDLLSWFQISIPIPISLQFSNSISV